MLLNVSEMTIVVGNLWWHIVSTSLAWLRLSCQHNFLALPSWSRLLLVFCTFDTFSGSIIPR